LRGEEEGAEGMKRYDLVRANGASAMLVAESGEWVRFEGVADLQVRNSELRAQRDNAESHVVALKSPSGRYVRDAEKLVGELVEALDGMVKVACSSCCCCGEYARALEVIKKARGDYRRCYGCGGDGKTAQAEPQTCQECAGTGWVEKARGEA